MSLVQSVKPSMFRLSKYKITELCYISCREPTWVRLRYSRYDFFQLSLIIENGNLFSCRILKLSPQKRISRYDSAISTHNIFCHVSDSTSGHQHRCKWNFLVALNWIFALFWYYVIFHKHVSSRNPIVIENCVTIVFVLKSIFWSYISCLNSFVYFKSLWISDRNQKDMDSIFFPLDNELSKYCGVIAVNSQVSDPPFCSSDFRSIDNKWLSPYIIGSSSHQTLYIRPMSELSLTVTSDDLSSFRRLYKHLFLFLVT